jgi:hypothetical protein
MNHEYSDKLVTPWGGMQEMKKLIDKTGISKKLGELNLPEGKSNNTIDASDLDDFVGVLSTTINANRTNTVLIEEFYCHSNCHGSCHGSL